MKEDGQPLDLVTAAEYATWFKALGDASGILIVSLGSLPPLPAPPTPSVAFIP